MESGVQRSDLDRDLAWKYVPGGNLLRQALIICTAGGSVVSTDNNTQTGVVSGLELKCQLEEISLYQSSKYHQSDFLGGGFLDRNLI